jgi:hypothetical protein
MPASWPTTSTSPGLLARDQEVTPDPYRHALTRNGHGRLILVGWYLDVGQAGAQPAAEVFVGADPGNRSRVPPVRTRTGARPAQRGERRASRRTVWLRGAQRTTARTPTGGSSVPGAGRLRGPPRPRS